jgi:nucleotide-binding universal stress UspA family protein
MLKHWVKRVAHAPARTHVTIRIGEPVEVILARAVAIRSDLIVMTSRACSGLKNELQRSSAERISRLAPCPVLTIPEKCADELAYSQDGVLSGKCQVVLMPVDFSTAAECALPIAADISAACGARLILAHGMEADANEEQIHARLRLWAERLLEVRDEPLSCETAVWPGGHSLYAILSEALRAKASLIVLPTRIQSWAQRLRAGSITDGLMRQAPCPVLSINENV